MNAEEKYQLVREMQQKKAPSETIHKLALEIIGELIEQYPGISQRELGVLIRSYSIAYLGTFFLKNMKENFQYVDQMMDCLTKYMEHYPDDEALFDCCISTLITALRYEDAYDLCQRLYTGNGNSKRVALKWLSSGLFEGDEILTPEETAAYRNENRKYGAFQ